MKKRQSDELETIFTNYMKKAIQESSQGVFKTITSSQYFVMKFLKEQGSSNVSDLANELQFTLSAITSLSDKLIKLGYLKRERSKSDRRIVQLSLTEKGETVVDDMTSQRKQKILALHDNLSEQEVEEIIRLYKKMLDHIS